MFPSVYGFSWTIGNIIFLGIFFIVVVTIGSTVLLSLLRAFRRMQAHHPDAIRWESDFHDLPIMARNCRHQFTGEFKQRTCENGFDCRSCMTHAQLIQGKPTNSDDIGTPIQVSGFSMPIDRLYHRGHTWVKSDATGCYTVGLDDFAARLVGTPDGIELPAIGKRVLVNGSAWRMNKGDSSIRILSPLEGDVVATGDGSEGWYVKIKPHAADVNTTHLLRDREAAAWLLWEFGRMQQKLSDPKIGVTLADGGAPVKDFMIAYPGKNWDAIWSDMFLET